MVKTIKSIKEISADNLEPGLFLIDYGEEEWDKAKNGIITLSKAPLFIDDSPDLSIDEMHTLAKVIISEGKVRVFIIDGIHLLEEENPIKQLEEMAADLNVTIIALRKHNTQ